MTALSIVVNAAVTADTDLVDRLDRSLIRQGFDSPVRRRLGPVDLSWFPTPGQPIAEARSGWESIDDGFIACVGTLFYRGLGGARALQAFWQDFDGARSPSPQQAFGNYLVVVAKHGSWWVVGDRVGLVHLYTIDAMGVYCTSWLACLELLGTPVLDRFGASEYILEGANHGDRTVVAGIGIADPAKVLQLPGRHTQTLVHLQDWCSAPAPKSESEAVEAATRILSDRARTLARAFPGKLRCALSGGFDSRLILAMLLGAGEKPGLFVYGTRDDPDVRIAAQCAREVGLTIELVDKDAMAAAAGTTTEAVMAANIDFFDGIPIDGIFDPGPDRITRLAQSAAGSLALNGGGGEIMRNFFYLPRQSYTAHQIEQSFYRGYPSDVFRSDRARADYRDRIRCSIESVVGPGSLERPRVDLIYPLFRNRYWAGRNNSIAARTGAFVTPLLDPELIRLTVATPLAWRNYGRLESKIICSLHPDLSRTALTYGFSPRQGPGWAYRLKMAGQQSRPPWLRGQSANIKKLLSRARPTTIARQLVPGPLSVDDVLNVSNLRKTGQLLRALTLEVLVRRYGMTLGPE